MFNNKRFFMFVVLTILLQCIFYKQFDLLSSNFPFFDGVIATTHAEALKYRYLLNWYIPIISMSFYFSGTLTSFIRKKGIVLFIRHYSKGKWIIKQYLLLFMNVLVFVFSQTIITAFFQLGRYQLPLLLLAKNFFLYFFMLCILLSIEFLLELYVKAEIAHLLINVYIVASILIVSKPSGVLSFFSYLSLPSYGMGFRNTLSNVNEFKLEIINPLVGIGMMMILEIIIILIAVKRMKKIDLI